MENKYIGTLLGGLVGDCLGAPLEFMTKEEITTKYGKVVDILGGGKYTDDTEMTLALAKTIICCGKVDPEECARNYVAAWGTFPFRGYGPSVSKSLHALKQGVSWKDSGRVVHFDGSYGNGAVMRIAPVALRYYDEPLWKIKEAVYNSSWCTHSNKVAIDAAFTRVLNIQKLLRGDDLVYSWDIYDSDEHYLRENCSPSEFGTYFQIKANEAVSCATYLYSKYGKDPENCLIESVNMGGDTDTIGCIVGSLLGAKYGTDWIPLRWLEKAEGVEEVTKVAKTIYRLGCK